MNQKSTSKSDLRYPLPFSDKLLGGPVPRECIDHIIAWDERHLKSVLQEGYQLYRNRAESALELGHYLLWLNGTWTVLLPVFDRRYLQ
jgi:hypothetical protein